MSVLSEIDGFAPDRIEISCTCCNKDSSSHSFGNVGGSFDSIEGLAVDSSNNVYVVDSGNNRIQ